MEKNSAGGWGGGWGASQEGKRRRRKKKQTKTNQPKPKQLWEMIKETVLVSERRQHQGLGEMPLPDSAAAVPGCGGRVPLTNGAAGGLPFVPPGPIAVTVPGLRPGDLATRGLSPPYTASPAPVGRAVFIPLPRDGSFTEVQLKTFLEELWARKTFFKGSLGWATWKSSSPLTASCDAARRPGLSQCNVPRGEKGFQKAVTGNNTAGKSITKCISCSGV